MKNLRYLALFLLLAPVLTACEKDNYPEPQETFRGSFIDKVTRKPFQTAIGNSGIRIRMMEYSWSDTPQPYDFNAMMDGTFQNTKVFAGNYGVTPEGAFVPFKEEILDIKGTVVKNYEVEPLLRVEWVGEPVLKADGSVEVKVKVTRGTKNSAYQQGLAEGWLFVSETNYVGDFSYSNNYSTKLSGARMNLFGTLETLNESSPDFGAGVTMTIPSGYSGGLPEFTGDPTKDPKPKPFPAYSRKFFLRVGVRTSQQFSGVNRYNYSSVKTITTVAQ